MDQINSRYAKADQRAVPVPQPIRTLDSLSRDLEKQAVNISELAYQVYEKIFGGEPECGTNAQEAAYCIENALERTDRLHQEADRRLNQILARLS